MNALEVLEKLEATGSARNSKISLLQQHGDIQELRWLLGIAYDYRITFGIKTRPTKIQQPSDMSMDNFVDFIRLLHLYRNRDLTGNAAKHEWEEMFKRFSDAEQKWYTRVLNKDLKSGLALKTLNSAWENFLDTFGVMLAHTYKPEKMKLKFPVAIEPKIDGMRVLILVKDSKANAYSREGRLLPHLQFIADECSAIIRNNPGSGSAVFDGEIFSTNWNETISLVKRGDMPASLRDKLIYNVFDFLGYDEFHAGSDKTPFKKRRENLECLDLSSSHLHLTKMEIANNENDIVRLYNKSLLANFEGIMIKLLDAPYAEDRHGYWLKYKPEDTKDAPIIGWYEGREGTKNEGRLGGFIVDLGNKQTLRVGGGYSDKQRDQFWRDKGKMVGMWLEYKEQVETNEENAVTKKARFGRFIRLREDRS